MVHIKIKYLNNLQYFTHLHNATSYSPGIIYAISSISLDIVSWELTFISVTCWVRQINGPKAHKRESKRTDTLPFTAICP